MSNELSKNVVPSYLANLEGVESGIEALQQYRQVPRVKIIQGTTSGELGDNFNQGDVVIVPDMTLVATKGESFTVVPVYSFHEWAVWNPWELVKSGQLDPIARDYEGNVMITTDPKSDIAVKAKEFHKEPCELDDTQWLTWQNHLNFVCAVFDNTGAMHQAMLSFQRMEHKTGRKWANLITARSQGGKIPLYAFRYIFSSAKHQNDKGNWFGFDIKKDTDNPYVPEDLFESFMAEYKICKEQHLKNMLGTNYESDNSNKSEVAEETEF